MKPFMDEDFLLQTETAKLLYHEYAAPMPVLDYHCHISPQEIAEDRRFNNLSEIWLHGDHYKWRAMRTNGVDEKYCTGDATDWEKISEVGRNCPLHHAKSPLSLDPPGIAQTFWHSHPFESKNGPSDLG